MLQNEQPGLTADLILNPQISKWQAIFQGRIIASSNSRQYIIDTITRGLNKTAKACGVTNVKELTSGTVGDLLQANDFVMPTKPTFTITERFEFLENLAQMSIEGAATAVLVTGEGGLGKSHTIMDQIKKAGLTMTSDFSPPPPKEKKEAASDSDPENEEEAEEEEEEIAWVNPGDCHLMKGFSSAKGLYRTLYEMNGKLIVLDDCDSVLKDANAVNILKGALDSSEERWVSWNAEEGRGISGLPRQFRFIGRVIFISNKSQHQIDPNLKTRCMRVDLTMTPSEKIERMEYIIHTDEFKPEVEMQVKVDALEFLREHMDVATNLSLRSLLDTMTHRNRNKPSWERQALYNLTA